MIHYVLILAAGKGTRLKNSQTLKQFLTINDLPIIMHSVIAFKNADPNCRIYIGLPKNYTNYWKILCKKYNFHIDHTLYNGGKSRIKTVFNGLEKIYQDQENSRKKSKLYQSNNLNKKKIVSIHDSARPFIDKKLILALIKIASQKGIAIPVIKLKSSLRSINLQAPPLTFAKNRSHYVITQTPQVFHFEDIYESYVKINRELSKYNNNQAIDDKYFFDDAGVYEYCNPKSIINLVDGREHNIKITTDLDYILSPIIYDFVKKNR